MKDLMNSKLFSAGKNNPKKTAFILHKNECTRKAWIAAINRKEETLPKNVYLCSRYFEEACFNKS